MKLAPLKSPPQNPGQNQVETPDALLRLLRIRLMRTERFFRQGSPEEALDEWDLTGPVLECLGEFPEDAFQSVRSQKYLRDCHRTNQSVQDYMSGQASRWKRGLFHTRADRAIHRLFQEE